MDNVQKFGKDVAVPKSPESEGSRLITLKQIEQEHGVSRSALHTYRRSASFPQPVPVEGSTKIQYSADEVAAWFEANPPSQGKRNDLASPEGAPMQATNQPTRESKLTADEWAVLSNNAAEGVIKGALKSGLSEQQSGELATASRLAIQAQLQEWGLLAE